MKTAKIIYLMTGLLALSGVVNLQAEEKPKRDEARERFKDLTPEEREAKFKEFQKANPDAAARIEKGREEMRKMGKDLGLKMEELEKLSVEERRAKVKEAGEKKMAELEKKKTDGTITEDEKVLLGKLETQKKRMEEFRSRGGAPGSRTGNRLEKKVEKKDGDKPEEKK